MIRIGKVYKNFMVDLKPVNHKLVLRSIRLIRELTGCSEEEARSALEASARRPKIAIVMVLLGVDAERAACLLEEENGHISSIMEKRNSGLYEK
jgi:N-acetylmuramic acid 6-phosphate etherase